MLTKKEENKLFAFERKVLRTSICCLKFENSVYRMRYNHELGEEFNIPNALNVTKTNRFRYAGHMIRRPEDLPQKALFRAKPNGRRNQRRPKSRWADGVNTNSDSLVPRSQGLDARQADMEKFSSTGLNQILVVVRH
jgi:hypothetical protein